MENIFPLKFSAKLHSWSALKVNVFQEWEKIRLIAVHPCPRLLKPSVNIAGKPRPTPLCVIFNVFRLTKEWDIC